MQIIFLTEKYHLSGAGIVQNLATNEQSFYLEQTDDIISLTINQHPKFPNVVATGKLCNF